MQRRVYCGEERKLTQAVNAIESIYEAKAYHQRRHFYDAEQKADGQEQYPEGYEGAMR